MLRTFTDMIDTPADFMYNKVNKNDPQTEEI